MTEFTPGAGGVGGALIGLASAGLLLSHGRIAGISGLVGRSLLPDADDASGSSWRLLFLLGLPLGAWLAGGLPFAHGGFEITTNLPLLAAGGLLVGVGTQLGNGCTSGHGVCGIARGSRRSIAATCLFMASAALTVFVVRHVLGGAS